MGQSLTDSRLANVGANAIHKSFDAYQTQFKSITRRAQARFEERDWRGMQADAVERLELYKKIVEQILIDVRRLLSERSNDKLIWASLKAVYSGLIAGRDDWELAETFFNSVTRRIFTTIGVDPQIEFVDTDFETPPTPAKRPVYRLYERAASTLTLFETILQDYRFGVAYQDLPRDIKLAATEVEIYLRDIGALRLIERAEIIDAVFYRGQGAYLVGRLFSGTHLIPLVLALLNTPSGIAVDAVLLSENDISVLFGFTRSYFHLVFQHDRAGRLVDAQEFEHLKFERWRFSGDLLQELQCLARETVEINETHVIIKHLYVERQVIPLNIYLREADAAAARAAVVDYGHAMKDLAASGIFPGDLLLKNFGVTRHGRVVFYDYDELCLLSECNFRALPQSRTYEEEIAAEPWFTVRDNDVFPEEFERFLGLQGNWREVFLAHHADLFDPAFWQQQQARLNAGEVMHIFPYDRSRRLLK